jgi:hypothetical protein
VRPVTPPSRNAVPGIIETLSGGFESVNRVLWIIAVPILTDLGLWLVPRLTAAPVFESLRRWYEQMLQAYSGVSGGGVDTNTLEQSRQIITTMATDAGHFNLLTLLVINIASVPSILPPPRDGAPSLEIHTVGTLVGVLVATQVLGILLGCLYLGVIGQQIRDGKVTFAKLGRRVWFYWLSVIGFILLVLGVSLIISIPIGLAIGLVQLIAPGLGIALWAAASTVGYIVAVLSMIYLFFLVDAIVVSEVGPVRAAISSAQVVANNFWATVGFILLTYMISLGMQVIWKTLSGSPAGVVIAIVGNAYVASGLAAASLLYYKTRAARLRPAGEVLDRGSPA